MVILLLRHKHIGKLLEYVRYPSVTKTSSFILCEWLWILCVIKHMAVALLWNLTLSLLLIGLVPGACVWVLAARTLRASVRRGQGRPVPGGSRWFRRGSRAGRSWACQQCWWHFWEDALLKGQNTVGHWGVREQTALWTPRLEEEGGGAAGAGADCLAACGDTMEEQVGIPWGNCDPWREAHAGAGSPGRVCSLAPN